MTQQGKVYLVGAGPGDPGLITCRGRELLETADIVVYDYLVTDAIWDMVNPQAQRIYVGKKAGQHTLPQEEISALLVRLGRTGQAVVRLKGGDPFLFGRGGEEAMALADEGISFEVVPGVTAGLAVPAYAGIPVSHRAMASSVALVTGHEDPTKAESTVDLAAIARAVDTVVIFMGVGRLKEICRSLMEGGRGPDSPAALVQWGTLPDQRTVVATIATLAQRAQEEGIRAPALLIAGEVASLRERLRWFESRPLFGRTIVLTRPKDRQALSASGLRSLGARILEFPVTKILPSQDPGPLRQALAKVREYDMLLVMSVNALEAVVEGLLDQGLDLRHLAGLTLCAVGQSTARAMERRGLRPDLVPQKQDGQGLVESMASRFALEGRRVLLPRSSQGDIALVRQLTDRGAQVDQVEAYRTEVNDLDTEAMRQALQQKKVDLVAFASPSSVRAFVQLLGQDILVNHSSFRVVTIGSSTSKAAVAAGFTVHAEASDPSEAGLLATASALLQGQIPTPEGSTERKITQ